MEIKEIEKTLKNFNKYHCEYCDFKCFQICDWNRHISRPKHILNANGNDLETKKTLKNFFCCCGKKFKTKSGLWKHEKSCHINEKNEKNENTVDEINKDQLIKILVEQNAKLMSILENGTNHNNNNTTHTNSHNKAFNLNFFLNETCKNAMNITDFVDSIKLQLSDLMSVGEMGFVEGISNIIVKNLNALDETIRPVHCTDKKRETMYIKDEGTWTKEEDTKPKLKRMITKIADKNIRLLPNFREKYPEYTNSYSTASNIHDKMVVEIMETSNEKKEKIIKNISNATVIQRL